MEKNCEYCGKAFRPDKGHSYQKYCSRECERAYWKDNRSKLRKKFTYVCKNCGKEYQRARSDTNQYCSRECAFNDIGTWRRLDVVGEKRISKVCPICNNEFQANRSESAYCSISCKEAATFKICAYCGCVYQNGSYSKIHSRYCSSECKNKAHNKAKSERYIPKPAFGKVCKYCRKSYQTNRTMQQYCSTECRQAVDRLRKLESNHRRIILERTSVIENVDRAEIYNRDGWICQICGKRVDPLLRFPHLLSATLDHILPLANGGTHEKKNVQLAHLICNSRKSNTQPDQLRLFG